MKNNIILFIGSFLLIILFLFLPYIKKNNGKEYSCTYSDGSDPSYILINSEYIIDEPSSRDETKYKITEETKFRIIAERNPGKASFDLGGNTIYTFDKLKKSLKIQHLGSNYFEFKLSCEKL